MGKTLFEVSNRAASNAVDLENFAREVYPDLENNAENDVEREILLSTRTDQINDCQFQVFLERAKKF